MFLDDLISILTAAGVTTAANIFVSSKAIIPTGAGPYISISETGGSGPEQTHNAAKYGKGYPAYVRPNAQIFIRATTYPTARNMADTAYVAFYAVRNKLINGVFWRQIIPMQEPFDAGLDDLNRACVIFNIACVKRPNAQAS
jgi:hypothetical protein